MIANESLPRMSVSDYLVFERESEIRHELVCGYLYAMTGANDRHEEIAANLLAALHHHLQEYLLVAQDEPSIEIYRRTKVGWGSAIHQGIDTSIALRCIGLEIRLAQIYA
jgi:Uma2 family endonuclease